MKKTIKDYDLKNKKVIIRVDFNVPIKDGIILDDSRIVKSIKTIKYAKENGAKVILMSHLGRVKDENDLKNTLKPVAVRLEEILKTNVLFIDTTRGEKLEQAVNNMKPGDIILMENTRFEDLNGKLESSNDKSLGKYWASLGDIFINDAFGTSHRAHASNVGIASNLPNGIGFLIEEELKYMGNVLNNPKRPFSVILGGAKVSDKIGVIDSLVKKADYILIGGAMAYTFLKSRDINVGASIVDNDSVEYCKDLLNKYSDKIILPIDSVNGETLDSKKSRTCFINEIKNNEMGLDIGYNTIKLFKSYLSDSKTILWNGPVGYFENETFAKGTCLLCEVLKSIDAIKIVGGGDTGSAVKNLGYEDSVTFISTGGGATLELLEGKKMDGIDVINEQGN